MAKYWLSFNKSVMHNISKRNENIFNDNELLRGRAIEVSETRPLHFGKLSDHARRTKKQDFFVLVLGS
jgi:hypothetical protein